MQSGDPLNAQAGQKKSRKNRRPDQNWTNRPHPGQKQGKMKKPARPRREKHGKKTNKVMLTAPPPAGIFKSTGFPAAPKKKGKPANPPEQN